MKSENMVKDFEEFFRDAPSLSCAIVHPFLVIIFGEREREMAHTANTFESLE